MSLYVIVFNPQVQRAVAAAPAAVQKQGVNPIYLYLKLCVVSLFNPQVQRAVAAAPAAVQKRVANARWLRKLALEMSEMQVHKTITNKARLGLTC